MKKHYLFFLLFNTLIIIGYAQNKKSTTTTTQPANDDKFINFDGYQMQHTGALAASRLGIMDTRISDVFKAITGPPNLVQWNKAHPLFPINKWVPKTSIMLGVKFSAKGYKSFSTYTVNALSKSYLGYMFADKDSVATVLAMGINASNVKDYRFRVVENDSTELVPWAIPALQQGYGAKQPYGYFGTFHYPGKEIMVEVINVKNYNLRDGLVFNWRNHLKPVITYITGYKKGVNNVLNLSDLKKNQGYATKLDKTTCLPTNLRFQSDSFESMNLFFKAHQTIPYDIYWIANYSHTSDAGAKTDTVMIRSDFRDSILSFTKQYFDTWGKYELLIYPTGTKDKNRETKFMFEVTRPPFIDAKYSIFQMLPYLILIGVAFIIYYLYNKNRTHNITRQKQTATLKLNSVRAQLNPHFMFNALTSIQNLINQHDIEGANNYLSKFAGLTRQILNNSGQEMISLEDEIKLITDYLMMEQLRFGFNYEIKVDPRLNKSNTEIPTMLLQPFIENAAKHGVGALQDKGKIEVRIERLITNLVLIVADNGPGFNADSKSKNNFGLKLSKERIDLLNQIYKSQPVKLDINSSPAGSKITITLTDWVG